MTGAEETTEPIRPKRGKTARAAKTPESESVPATRQPRRGKGSSAPERDGTGGRKPQPQGLSAEALSRIIMPALRDVPQALVGAIEPAMQDYQREMANIMTQHIQHALPSIRQALEQEAEAEVDQALRGMERADQGHPGRQPDTREQAAPVESAPESRQDTETSGEYDSNQPADEANKSTQQTVGGTQMTSGTDQSEQSNSQQTSEDQTTQQQAPNQQQGSQQNQPRDGQQGQRDSNQQGQAGAGQRSQPPARSERSSQATYYFDPSAAAQAGMLELATVWKNAGGYYQCLNAYMDILTRYPQTGAAAAATEGLVDLARTFEKQGRFYAALDIYHKLEAVL